MLWPKQYVRLDVRPPVPQIRYPKDAERSLENKTRGGGQRAPDTHTGEVARDCASSEWLGCHVESARS